MLNALSSCSLTCQDEIVFAEVVDCVLILYSTIYRNHSLVCNGMVASILLIHAIVILILFDLLYSSLVYCKWKHLISPNQFYREIIPWSIRLRRYSLKDHKSSNHVLLKLVVALKGLLHRLGVLACRRWLFVSLGACLVKYVIYVFFPKSNLGKVQ